MTAVKDLHLSEGFDLGNITVKRIIPKKWNARKTIALEAVRRIFLDKEVKL